MITTGNYNIIIGANIDAASATDDSQLNIGDTIYGDMNTDRIGIGKTPTVALDVSGDLTITGAGTKPGGGTWTATSDIRLKDVHGSYQKGLQDILKINPITFNYKKVYK